MSSFIFIATQWVWLEYVSCFIHEDIGLEMIGMKIRCGHKTTKWHRPAFISISVWLQSLCHILSPRLKNNCVVYLSSQDNIFKTFFTLVSDNLGSKPLVPSFPSVKFLDRCYCLSLNSKFLLLLQSDKLQRADISPFISMLPSQQAIIMSTLLGQG